MTTVPMPFFATPSNPTTPTRQWIRTELTALARELDLHDIRAVATTLANTALWDRAMDARRAQFAQLLTERLAARLDEAQARGELTLRVDSRLAAAVTIGPLYYRSTIEHAAIDDSLIDTVIAALGDWTTVREHGAPLQRKVQPRGSTPTSADVKATRNASRSSRLSTPSAGSSV
jgi:hypothetical protein